MAAKLPWLLVLSTLALGHNHPEVGLPPGTGPPCRKSPLLAALSRNSSSGKSEQILVTFGGKGWNWHPRKHGKGKGGKKDFTKEVTMLGDMWRFDVDTRTWYQIEDGSAPEARWKLGATGALDDSVLVLMGGCTETSVRFSKNDLWVFRPTDDPNGGHWHQVNTENTPVKRRGHVMVSNQTHLVIFGGKAKHKLAMESWRGLPRESGAAAISADGGTAPQLPWMQYVDAERPADEEDDEDDENFNPQKGEKCLIDLWVIPKGAVLQDESSSSPRRWTQGAPFPAGCRWGGTGSYVRDASGKKYLAMFGGRHLQAGAAEHTTASKAYVYYNDLWLYDFEEDRWSEAPTVGPRPPARDHHGAATIDEKLFIYGGRRSEQRASSSVLADIWSYNMETHSWFEHVPQGAAPSARFMPGVSSVTFEGAQQLAVFAGENLPGSTKRTTLNDVWVFDPRAATWKELFAPTCDDLPDLEEELDSFATDGLGLQLACLAGGVGIVLAVAAAMKKFAGRGLASAREPLLQTASAEGLL